MNKDFVTVPNASGNNNGSFDVTCEQNSGNERSTILTVSGGVNKTINITQKAPDLESIEIASCVYYPNGTLSTIINFGIIANITVSMTSSQIGRFIFPKPIIEMTRIGGYYKNTFLRIQVSEEIPSHYKGEKVVSFLESINGNPIYTPKKDLTVDVYSKSGKNVFDLNIADGITIGNTEIININSALNNRPNIAILLTNNKKIELFNFIWKAVYHDS